MWSALTNGTDSTTYTLNVCAPLYGIACGDVNAAACVGTGSAQYTLGSYQSYSITAASANIADGLILRYFGGANNHNSSSPGVPDGTCNSYYDRETIILFTCGTGLVCYQSFSICIGVV